MSGLRKRPRTTAISEEQAKERLERAADWIGQANLAIPSGVGQGIPKWATANDRVLYQYNVRLKESLYQKLKFLSENEPNISMHTIIIEGLEKEVAARLRKYEKAFDTAGAG
jgi:hypothetical protein